MPNLSSAECRAAIAACAVAVALSVPSLIARASQQPTALRIVVIDGEDAVNIIQQKTAVAPVVEVRDRNDLPVSGATVTFSIVGNSATFPGGQTFTIATNAGGRAMTSALTPLTRGAVQIQVQAVFEGQSAAAVISQTNVLTAAQAAAISGAGGNAAGGASGSGAAAGAGGHATALIVGGVAAAAGAGALVAVSGGSDEAAASAPPTPATVTFSGSVNMNPGIVFSIIPSSPTIDVATAGNYQFRVSFNSPPDCALLFGVCPSVGNCTIPFMAGPIQGSVGAVEWTATLNPGSYVVSVAPHTAPRSLNGPVCQAFTGAITFTGSVVRQ